MHHRTAGDVLRNLMMRVARLERHAFTRNAAQDDVLTDILSELEKRYIEPLEKESNGRRGYIGFESKDDAFQAVYALKRAFPSITFEVKSDRVHFKV